MIGQSFDRTSCDARLAVAVDESHARPATGQHRICRIRHIRGHGVNRLLVYCESLWCNHSATLTRPLKVRSGPTLETLEDAGRFIGTMPERDQSRQAWIRH
jgi:hypothetical protein